MSGLRANSSMSRLMLPMILGITFLAYGGALRYEFVYDDGEFIVRNQYLTSWSYLPRYFSEHLWSYQHRNRPGNYYRPLFLLWGLINRSLLGLNVVAWHFVTLLLYLGVVAMVYWLASRLLKDRVSAIIAAAVFALYPLHIETAAWVCGGSEALLASFFIPAFFFYLKSRDHDEKTSGRSVAATRWVVLSLVLYAAALFAKETAVTLPAIIIAYELIVGSGSSPNKQKEKRDPSNTAFSRLGEVWPLLLLYGLVTTVYLAIRTMVLGNIIYQPVRTSLVTKVLTVPLLFWSYLKLLVWPIGLSEFYDTNYVEAPGFGNFLLPLAGIVAVVLALGWSIKRIKDQRERSIVAFACAWIVIPILPVLNIGTFTKGDLIHDRYLFLPTVGLALLIAYGVRQIKVGAGELFGLPRIQALFTLVILGSLGVATANQHVHWANDIVLFHHSLSVAPDNELAQVGFGNALINREMYDDAAAVFESLAQKNPENAMGQYGAGYSYYKMGNYEQALPYLSAAAEMKPPEPLRYVTLGVTLYYLGKYDQAEQILRQGIRLRSSERGMHYALAAVFEERGRFQEALEEYRQEVEYNPDYASAYDQMEQIKNRIGAGSTHTAR
jgi:protein O-mannosyl-transferase